MTNNCISAAKALKEVATRNGVTVAEVKKQIQLAMLCGLCNNDPAVKEKWSEVPHVGDLPTPEELISHLAEKVTESIK